MESLDPDLIPYNMTPEPAISDLLARMNDLSPVAKENSLPMDSQPALVSVVIPTWNAADTLPETLETVFGQTWPNIQVVVIDDGSSDNTAEVLSRYGDQVTWETIENSGGPSRPRNRGIALSRGEFIAFFDSDDLMERDKIASAMEVFRRHPAVGFVCTNFRSIDVAGNVLQENYLQEYRTFRDSLQPTDNPHTALLEGSAAFRRLLRTNFVGTSSVLCRAEVLARVGPFDESMKNGDDRDMWLRIAREGIGFAFIDRILHSYRVTPGGVTARGAARIPAMIHCLEKNIPHCRRPQDRRFIQERIRQLHLERAWQLRQEDQLDESVASYRRGLAMGWGLRPWVGYLRALAQRAARGKS